MSIALMVLALMGRDILAQSPSVVQRDGLPMENAAQNTTALPAAQRTSSVFPVRVQKHCEIRSPFDF